MGERENLAKVLRETTAQMATSCSVPMLLWQAHSTAVLHAADMLAYAQSAWRPCREDIARVIDQRPWLSPMAYPDSWEGPEDVEAAKSAALRQADAILALPSTDGNTTTDGSK